MKGVTIVTPMSADLSAGIICFSVDGMAGYYNPAYTRLAPGLVTVESDVDLAVAAVAAIREGKRSSTVVAIAAERQPHLHRPEAPCRLPDGRPSIIWVRIQETVAGGSTTWSAKRVACVPLAGSNSRNLTGRMRTVAGTAYKS